MNRLDNSEKSLKCMLCSTELTFDLFTHIYSINSNVFRAKCPSCKTQYELSSKTDTVGIDLGSSIVIAVL